MIDLTSASREELLALIAALQAQVAELQATIDAVPCDLVLVGTPFDLASQLHIDKPALRVRYSLEPLEEEPSLPDLILKAVKR